MESLLRQRCIVRIMTVPVIRGGFLMIRKLRGLGVSDPLESVSCYQHRCRRLCSMVKKQHKAVGDVPELIEKRIHEIGRAHV